ncbi:MAG: DNA polymerase III subunit tau [Candidatus Izimaplasma bacterium HR2]|nr:MAG: DNA polymerase III subunit tau [Candidatus Izimaplasma bacterium HR2]
MAFDKIRSSQPKVVQLLENSIKKDRLSHAYLFEGEKGTKKYETALYFAQMLMCTSEDKPCLECHNCRRILNGTHPNVYVVEPFKNLIKKQQIIDLQNEFSKTSVERGPKIYIIKNIDLINVSAANSLLKFLEEPYPNTYAVLTSSNINKILPTIISRSQVVQFNSLNKKIIEDEMIETGYPKLSSRIVANLTNSITEALDIVNNEYFLELMDLVKEVNNIIATGDESLIIYFNENSSIIYQDKEFSNLFLSLLVIYQKDLINYKINDVDNIIFNEELETISTISTRKTKNRLIDDLESMLSLKAKLNNYINERLAYDNLLLSLERR